MGKQTLYNILITGPPISGKTLVAKRLRDDLTESGFNVSNFDVDYDKDFKTTPEQTDIYLLQTPHGLYSEKIDKIKFKDFDKLIYVNPEYETYLEFLSNRGDAWFREGVVEKTEDFNPSPYSLAKLPKIIKKIANYALNHKDIVKSDIDYFSKNRIKLNVVVPFFNKGLVEIQNYSKTLDEILCEVKNESS